MTELELNYSRKDTKLNLMVLYFLGVATISVVAGQIYVGLGYRQMANTVEDFRNAYISRNKY